MKPQALSPVDAREAIDRLLEHPAALVLTSHVRARMRERRFTTDDVLRVLRHGTIRRVANWDDQRGVWKYQVSYRDLDGDPLSLVVPSMIASR